MFHSEKFFTSLSVNCVNILRQTWLIQNNSNWISNNKIDCFKNKYWIVNITCWQSIGYKCVLKLFSPVSLVTLRNNCQQKHSSPQVTAKNRTLSFWKTEAFIFLIKCRVQICLYVPLRTNIKPTVSVRR